MLNGYPRIFGYGANWEPMRTVLPGKGQAIMNPCPVLDQSTGRIWLPCYEVRGGLKEHIKDPYVGRLLLTWSDDEGLTWASPRDLTASMPRFIPGPGVGIQLRTGPRASRLMATNNDQRSQRCGQIGPSSVQVRPRSLERHSTGKKSLVAVFADRMNEQRSVPSGSTTARHTDYRSCMSKPIRRHYERLLGTFRRPRSGGMMGRTWISGDNAQPLTLGVWQIDNPG